MILHLRIEVVMLLEVTEPHRAAQSGHAYNETALAALGVGLSGETRAKVAIGFVDYGFDLLHPTLRDPSGSKSRFRFLWDQNSTPAAAERDLDLGRIDDWDGARLDHEVAAGVAIGSRRALDALYDPHANNCGRHGTVGGAHGTMMASIAAGTPSRDFAAPRRGLK
jgi:hypothetical protein